MVCEYKLYFSNFSVTEIKFQISPTGPTDSWTGLALFRIEVCLVAVH